MPCPTPPASRPRLRKLHAEPWSKAAKRSPALAEWCSQHGYLTPNFTVKDMADTGTHGLPLDVRSNARRHCFDLEVLRHELGKLAGRPVPITIDGPFRTREHNAAIHGASDSRHVHGDASDHFIAQVARWARAIQRRHEPIDSARARVVALCERIFSGVGNENSGTLHLDSRPGPWVRFVTWVGVR